MASAKGPVLVVEDDEDVREAIRDTLEGEGYLAETARDGSDALAYLRAHPPPPLILLDWNMAPMNGLQFMQAFAQEPMSRKVPVILVTADARVDEKARNNGFAGALRKPVNLDALFVLVERYCA